jgi:cation transport regulator ChaC
MPPEIWVFFYGSYINREVLKEVDLAPEHWESATLSGFELVIAPRANLQRSSGHVVFGVLAKATHGELERLYADHAKGVLGETYLPEAVLTSDESGRLRPALTYIAPSMEPRPAELAYVERIAQPAERYGFPDWYVERIRNFRPIEASR